MQEKQTPNILLIVFRILFTGFALWVMYFIFSNSLEIASISSSHSSAVTERLNAILEPMGFPYLSSALVRKLAHFAEYTLLGFWYMMCTRVYTNHYLRHISWPLLLVLGMALTDETLQMFVDGRSSSVFDVWIDFGGGCVGLFIALLLIMLLSSFFYLLGFGRKKERIERS